MTRLRIKPCGHGLQGTVRMPGDKSIGHRALLLAALAQGTSRIGGLSAGLDNLATARALSAMGVNIRDEDGQTLVDGVGLLGLRPPATVLDCGNSGTTMRLLAGLLAGQRFGTQLVGDASLSRRPMRRVVDPLVARGATIGGQPGLKANEIYPPLVIDPLTAGKRLSGLEYDMPTASAQVKSALLLSGLTAAGPTAIKEPTVSRDHTERMLLALGVPIQTAATMVVLDPEEFSGEWAAFDWQVPGDFSSAAFVIAAVLLVTGSAVTIENVGLNPTRTGLLDALRAMGAPHGITPRGDAAGGEPIGVVEVRHGSLRRGMISGEVVVRAIDEVPAFCAIATAAAGTTEVRDARELRVKESDRIAMMIRVLTAFGVSCDELGDGLRIHGGTQPKGATVASAGDHRIAMTAAVLGLAATGETVVEDADCIATSFPEFVPMLRELGADITEEPSP